MKLRFLHQNRILASTVVKDDATTQHLFLDYFKVYYITLVIHERKIKNPRQMPMMRTGEHFVPSKRGVKAKLYR